MHATTLLITLLACGEPDEGESETGPVEGGGDCPGEEVSWDLVEAWRSVDGAGQQVAVARLDDSTGDLRVDDDDVLSIVRLSWSGAAVLGPDGSVAATLGTETYRLQGRLGDVDGLPGAEVVAHWMVTNEAGDHLTVFGGTDVDHSVPEGQTLGTWLADVDGDGQVDVASPSGVYDPVTGVALIEPPAGQAWWTTPIALDLDLDGDVEVIGAVGADYDGELRLGLLGPDGDVAEPCLVAIAGDGVWIAVGELDGDPEGEFAVASPGVLALCDTDGSFLASTTSGIGQPAVLAIGDLDGDLSPEVLLSGNAVGGRSLVAFDLDLAELWRMDREAWLPFSLADLDADGVHEVIVAEKNQLHILAGDGSLLSTWSDSSGTSAWRAAPVVADVDDDGLAEILRPMDPLVLLDTPAGGFPAPGAREGWSGMEHFPGYLAPDGTVDVTGAHWLTPGQNAWNARATCVSSGEH